MTYAVPIGIAIVGALAIFLIVIALLPASSLLTSRIRRIERLNEKELAPREVLVNRLVTENQKSSMRQWLNEAGWYDLSPTALAVRTLRALGIGILIGAFLIAFSHQNELGIIAGLMYPLLAWAVPSVRLQRAIRKRKTVIARDLPEFVDMLSTTVQAGLSLNAGIVQGASTTSGVLKEELTLMLAEARLGRSLGEALEAMAVRVNEPSMTTMVTAIVQAEALGSNLSGVLREVAKDSRERRWTRAEEQAAQLPVKMLIPMVFFMIPSLYLMIFGPVVADFIQHF